MQGQYINLDTISSLKTKLETGQVRLQDIAVIGRQGGHTFVMDDGDLTGSNQLIRLSTAQGHQITMSDDGQTLFIIHSNGQSYIELGKEGTIDMYSTNSVNIRTQGDLNLHADNNININAEKNINIRAKENLVLNSEKETNIRVGTDFKQQVLSLSIYSNDLHLLLFLQILVHVSKLILVLQDCKYNFSLFMSLKVNVHK